MKRDESEAEQDTVFSPGHAARGQELSPTIRRVRGEIAATLPDDDATRVTIGRYRIVRELGAGGMGLVFLALDEQLSRHVAIKLIQGDHTSDEARARLQREAQAMARLSHPNVVTVHEVGAHGDRVFVAMEYVRGQDLRSWLAAEARHWRDVLKMFLQAGQGLAAAHEAGIVHRDFKPENRGPPAERPQPADRSQTREFGRAGGGGHYLHGPMTVRCARSSANGCQGKPSAPRGDTTPARGHRRGATVRYSDVDGARTRRSRRRPHAME